MQVEGVSEHECVHLRIVYCTGYSKRLFTEVRRVDPKTIVVMEGDQTGQELLEEALRVLDPAVTGLDLDFVRYDLSLENRRATDNEVVHQAAAAMKETGFGIKAATVTPEEPGDVGSPNAILRTGIDGTVIVLTGRRSGAKARGLTRSPTGPRRSRAGYAAAYRSSPLSRRARCGPRSLAAPSTPSPPSTRGCSRRRWTAPQRTAATSATTPSS